MDSFIYSDANGACPNFLKKRTIQILTHDLSRDTHIFQGFLVRITDLIHKFNQCLPNQVYFQQFLAKFSYFQLPKIFGNFRLNFQIFGFPKIFGKLASLYLALNK